MTIHDVIALWKERDVGRNLGLFGAGSMDVR